MESAIRKRAPWLLLFQCSMFSGEHRAHTPAHRHTLHSISVILQFRSNWHRDRHNASKQPQRKCSRRRRRRKQPGENGKKIEIRFSWRAISQFTITGERDALYPLNNFGQSFARSLHQRSRSPFFRFQFGCVGARDTLVQ